jgi:hypothetical protein
MKRILIFAVLGPLLGIVTGLFVLLPVIAVLAGEPMVFDIHQIVTVPVLLPVVYMVGLIPALLVGSFDAILARWNIGQRVLWCALFGFAVSFLPLVTSLSMGFLHGPFVLTFGLLGAVPGAICSWIAGKVNRQGAT